MLLALACAAAPARAAEPPVPLPWRAGGRVGFTVDAAAFPESTGYTLDVYVRIPPTTLVALDRDAGGMARIALTVGLRNPYGGKLPDRREEFSIGPEDTVGGFGKVVVLRYATVPGPHRLRVRLADLLSKKPGIAYIGHIAHEAVSADGTFEVPLPQGGRDLSDLEFVWSEPDSGSSGFRRAGRTRLPNPERLYGLFASDLKAFFVARTHPGNDRAWQWVARVVDSTGKVVAAQESTGTASPWLSGSCTIDVSTLPAGGYDLDVKAWQAGDSVALERRSHFNVAWQQESWLRNPRDVQDEVHLLFDSEAEDRFALLGPGEQERELDDFWRRRDPTPGTAHNEALETFRQRVAYANRMYSRPGLLRGMFSDMGRVFIRYGEPTEISRQVIPAGNETVLQELHDLEITEDRPSGEANLNGPGDDQRPFEVWVYEPPVPTPIDADPEVRDVVRHKRLVFVFVDEQGLGNYTLRYSTE